MPHSAPIEDEGRQPSDDRCKRALAEAISGLEIIRDEGPAADPTYPTHGGIEAHEAWGFDSASHERAETARDTLGRVTAIVADEPAST